MRLAIPAALVFLAGVAFGRRGTGDAVRPPDPPPGTASAAPSMDVKEDPVVTIEAAREDPPDPAPPVSSGPAPARPVAGAPAEVARSSLMARLQEDLSLDPAQVSYVTRVLREREAEIRECHERYRRCGVLDVRDYEWWVADRKAIWFRRVDAVLDRFQHERWTALVARNVLGDGLEFEVADGMAVLE